MNFNELSQKNNTESKENIIENLETAALKIKAENSIIELDRKSEEIITTLAKFSEKVPIMINRLEAINEGLKLESFNKTIEDISNSSKEIIKCSKSIIENNKKSEEKIVNIAEKEIYLISEKANKNINKREYFYYLLDRSILIVFIAVFIINITMMFFYKRQLNQINYEFNKIHNILMDNEKYWIDKDNFDIFIKYNKNSH